MRKSGIDIKGINFCKTIIKPVTLMEENSLKYLRQYINPDKVKGMKRDFRLKGEVIFEKVENGVFLTKDQKE